MSKSLKKVFKPVARIVNAIPGGNILASAALAAIPGGAQFIPLLSAATTIGSGGSIGQGLLSAGGSYLGGKLGANVFGDTGSVGQGLSNTFGNSTGNAIASNIGDLAGTQISSGLGSFAGNSLADSFSGANELGMPGAPKAPSGPAPFSPSQQDQQDLPASLQGFGGLDAGQQGTNIANQGVYGQGLGPDEQNYFLNLVNRRLVDQGGQTSDLSNLQPIESSYLQKLGLGGYGNSNDLLKAISTWHAA